MIKEKREIESLLERTYKANIGKIYNKRVKEQEFKVDDLILRKNEAIRGEPGDTLGPTWEGPYKVVETHSKGSYVLETME